MEILFLSINGMPYGGDRQLRDDGTFDPELPPRPDPRYQWDGSAWTLTLDPDWENLTAQFQFPGNALYASIASQVAVAGFATQDHWGNFKLMLLTPSQRSPETLAAGMNYLAFLLAMAGQTIAPEVKSAWNQLLTANHFPDTCLLSLS